MKLYLDFFRFDFLGKISKQIRNNVVINLQECMDQKVHLNFFKCATLAMNAEHKLGA